MREKLEEIKKLYEKTIKAYDEFIDKIRPNVFTFIFSLGMHYFPRKEIANKLSYIRDMLKFQYEVLKKTLERDKVPERRLVNAWISAIETSSRDLEEIRKKVPFQLESLFNTLFSLLSGLSNSLRIVSNALPEIVEGMTDIIKETEKAMVKTISLVPFLMIGGAVLGFIYFRKKILEK